MGDDTDVYDHKRHNTVTNATLRQVDDFQEVCADVARRAGITVDSLTMQLTNGVANVRWLRCISFLGSSSSLWVTRRIGVPPR
jgi:hypothetical protein